MNDVEVQSSFSSNQPMTIESEGFLIDLDRKSLPVKDTSKLTLSSDQDVKRRQDNFLRHEQQISYGYISYQDETDCAIVVVSFWAVLQTLLAEDISIFLREKPVIYQKQKPSGKDLLVSLKIFSSRLTQVTAFLQKSKIKLIEQNYDLSQFQVEPAPLTSMLVMEMKNYNTPFLLNMVGKDNYIELDKNTFIVEDSRNRFRCSHKDDCSQPIAISQVSSQFITNYIIFTARFNQDCLFFLPLWNFLHEKISSWTLRYKFLQKEEIQFAVEIQNWINILLCFKKCSQLGIYASFTSYETIKNMKILKKNQCNQKAQSTLLLSEQIANVSDTALRKDFPNMFAHLNTDIFEDDNFESNLNFILDNWEIFRLSLQSDLKTLQSLLSIRIQHMKEHQTMFPTFSKLMSKIQTVTGHRLKKQRLPQDFNDSETDILYIHFFSQLESRSNQVPYYVTDEITKKRMLLADLVASHKDYQGAVCNGRWQDVFDRLLVKIRNNVQKLPSYSKKAVEDARVRLDFSNHVERERLVSLQCISCCQFFYRDINIWDPFVNKTPIITAGRMTGINEDADDLKDKICYLLNNGGGVILFDCARKYRQIIPMGEYLKKQDMDSFLQRLEKIAEGISPPPQMTTNLQLTYVPMIENPMIEQLLNHEQITRNDKCYDQIYLKRNFIEGLYVARIKVRPTTPWRAYFWMANSDKPIFPLKTGENEFTPLCGSKIYNLLKQNFENNYIPEDIDQLQREEQMFLSPVTTCFHEGQCLRPEPGIPISNKQAILANVKQPQKQFSEISLLIARKVDHPVIKQRLRRRNFECEIVSLYQNQNFKAAVNSAAIYHKRKFDDLLTEMSYNKDYAFNGKYSMLVALTRYLKLPNFQEKTYQNEQCYRKMQQALMTHHPKEKIKFWKYEVDPQRHEFQYFVETGSKQSLILMYYVLAQCNEKCFFKYPKNLEKLSEEEKLKRFKQLPYPERSTLRQSPIAVPCDYLEAKDDERKTNMYSQEELNQVERELQCFLDEQAQHALQQNFYSFSHCLNGQNKERY